MEAAVEDFVIGKLGDILVQQIVDETALVFNFTKDFEWLKRELIILRSSLQYAYGQSTQDDDVKQWIQNVRDIALDTEDILEEHGVESLDSDSTCSPCGCSYRQLLYRYKMGRRIREIKDRVSLVIENAKKMNIWRSTLQQGAPSASSSTSQTKVWRRSSVLERDAQPMAAYDKVQDIVKLLEKADVSVIAVVGMGGVGKTFLMQIVLKEVQHMFETSVWLSISKMYSDSDEQLHQLQCDLASQLVSHLKKLKSDCESGRSWSEASQLASQIEGLEHVGPSGISPVEGERLIHSSLEGKNILIVLDDVWRPLQEDNLMGRLGLPSSCKIVVTTRNRQITNNKKHELYEVRPLLEKDSQKLFCVYAFSDCPENRPPDYLKNLSDEIARECAGLPLAIKTVATSMADKREPGHWKLKLNQLKMAKAVDPNDPIMQIIKLSYDPLPASLKSCFAYLSFFPEDHEIDCEYLIYLWEAEGFIPVKDVHVKDDKDDPEIEIGWGYINQLANLGLIELREKSYLHKICKVHDLVLDFAVCVSRDNKCAFSVQGAFHKEKSCCRRILLAKKGIAENVIADGNLPSPGCVRTLTLFNNSVGDKVSANLFSHLNLRVLRVLDMSRTVISTLPESVGNLKLLRVLNLSNTRIEQVPECVRKLKSLRFLDISHNRGLVAVPAWIGELTRLQHLNIQYCWQINNHSPKGISKIPSLQTLRSDYLKLPIEENETESLTLEDLANLTKLREIWIEVNHEVQRKRLEEGILAGLENMRCLYIKNAGEQMANLPATSLPMEGLVSLTLAKFSVPAWIESESLKFLMLRSCECSDYSALALKMPSLTHLFLDGNESRRELPMAFGEQGAFPNLSYLYIAKFNVLEELWEKWEESEESEDRAMAALEYFVIISCPKIKNLPQGLERLKSLKELRFIKSGTDEVRKKLKEGGEVWSKIKASNPHVSILDRAW